MYKTIQSVDLVNDKIDYKLVLKHRNDTYLYRDNAFWRNLTNFLVDKYKDVQKVNVFDYACSNGSEAYTFIMQMLSNFKKEVSKKFFPVIAKDCDSYAIEKAKSGEIPISRDEECLINGYTGKQFDRFIGNRCGLSEQRIPIYNVRKELTNLVDFSVADIFEDLPNLPKSNNIVFARNFWPYLSNAKRNDLAELLSEYIGENSTLIVGSYDLMFGDVSKKTISQLMYDAGFEKVFQHELLDCVYEKRS